MRGTPRYLDVQSRKVRKSVVAGSTRPAAIEEHAGDAPGSGEVTAGMDYRRLRADLEQFFRKVGKAYAPGS